ncbi:hypothetical protein ACLQ3C_09285 [Gordonia sp. DT30]|uniref:hypothetical protein n=1 Tax=Gordonia sp. DT30 TaxID=3416546 RepID=UPI003CF41479
MSAADGLIERAWVLLDAAAGRAPEYVLSELRDAVWQFDDVTAQNLRDPDSAAHRRLTQAMRAAQQYAGGPR